MHLDAEKIKKLRKSKGISRQNLALELEISESALRIIENGGRFDGKTFGMTLETSYKLASYFGVKIDDLL